jgi:hypothetical protein
MPSVGGNDGWAETANTRSSWSRRPRGWRPDHPASCSAICGCTLPTVIENSITSCCFEDRSELDARLETVLSTRTVEWPCNRHRHSIERSMYHSEASSTCHRRDSPAVNALPRARALGGRGSHRVRGISEPKRLLPSQEMAADVGQCRDQEHRRDAVPQQHRDRKRVTP